MTFSWNAVSDLDQMWRFSFMVNAFRAGTIVAVLSAAVGWFMVARRQTFAGHTVAVVGFPGAAGAALIGLGATYGSLAFCLAASLVITAVPGLAGDSGPEASTLIGTVQAVALSLGYLFVSLYGGFLGGVNALLFGTFLGVSAGQVRTLLGVAVAAGLGLGLIARPLLFATVDARVASARGVPIRAVSVLFLVLLAIAVAEVSQVTGSLLVLALLVGPAATAQLVTARPVAGMVLAAALGVVLTWVALVAAYYSNVPIGFLLTTGGLVLYLATRLATRLATWLARGYVAEPTTPTSTAPTRKGSATA